MATECFNHWATGASRGFEFFAGKVNVTLANREQCSRLQQLSRCCYQCFCCTHRNSGLQCFLMDRTTPNIAPSHRGYRPHLWFLGPTRVRPPNGIAIGSVVLTGLMNVINRQTDGPRYPFNGRLAGVSNAHVNKNEIIKENEILYFITFILRKKSHSP